MGLMKQLFVKMESRLITLLLFIFVHSCHSEVYIVDGTNGDDTNNGTTIDDPFKTISRCVGELKNPGDECQIRQGYYHEVVNVTYLTGTEEEPYKIVGYQDEWPVWDGTVSINPLEWTHGVHGVCSAKIEQDITSLFYKDDLLTAARWPNALWSDRSVFDHKYWRPCGHSQRGTIVDDALAELPAEITGAMAILNIGSWETFVAEVLYHEAGSNNFTYNDHFGDIKFKNQQYYLEASMALLDAPEEWFYDMETKTLYLIMPNNTIEGDGLCPEDGTLRGRTLDYGLQITYTSWLVVGNMTFWGANLLAQSHDSHITLDSIIFKFPSSSHRMLKGDAKPIHTRVAGESSVVNCTFVGAEGPALQYDGNGVLIHNNDFSFNDWAGQGNLGTVMDSSHSHSEFSQNSMLYNGPAHGLRYTGRGGNITLNHMAGQCWGKIQSDGAAIQVSTGAQEGIHISYCWIYDTPKKGIRFDGSGNPMGHHGHVNFNVVWNAHGNAEIYTKGDNHTVTNNVAWDDDDQKGCTLCVPSSHSGYPMNHNTIVENNGASAMSSGGGLIQNNYQGQDVKHQMIDTDNYDFRPVPGGNFTTGSEIIGA